MEGREKNAYGDARHDETPTEKSARKDNDRKSCPRESEQKCNGIEKTSTKVGADSEEGSSAFDQEASRSFATAKQSGI